MDPFWAILTFIGSAFCHQLPERSLSYLDYQMPLCARCIGIHLGFLLSFIYLNIGRRRHLSGLPSKRSMIVLGLIAGIFLVDALVSYSGLSESDNLRRTVSGLALGTIIPFFVMPFLNGFLHKGENLSRPFDAKSDWLWLGLIYLAGAAMILLSPSNLPLFFAVSVLGIAGVLAFTISVFTLLSVLAFEKRPLGNRTKIAIGACIGFAFILISGFAHWLVISSV